VHEGETGVLFRAGDIQQLTAAISFLIERPELAAGMGAAGRALVVGQHSPASHYAALTRLYEQLATKPKKMDDRSRKSVAKPALRVAFIGGRGVISKYSGLETHTTRRLANAWPRWDTTSPCTAAPISVPRKQRTTGCAWSACPPFARSTWRLWCTPFSARSMHSLVIATSCTINA